MGWINATLAGAGAVMASVAVLAAPPQAGQAEKSERDSAPSRRERIIVTPQIEIFQGGARLGVNLRDLDDATAKEHKLSSPDGALVERVEPGSAAEKAGIKAGDVITSFDGERVRSIRQLQRLVGDTPAGRRVKLGISRAGRAMELAVTPEREDRFDMPGGDVHSEILERNLDRLRDLPRAFRFEWDDQSPGDIVPRRPAPRAPEKSPAPRTPFGPRLPLYQWSPGAGRLGVVVQELTPQLGEYFGAKEGVLVASVTDDSPAARAGVKAGDVITSVNGKAIADAEALLRAVRNQPDGEDVSLGILRDRKAQTLKVKLLASHRGRPI